MNTTIGNLNLALQGGGSHGAFTWGVLDRFLDDDRLAVEGISGVSSGAMNPFDLNPPARRAGGARRFPEITGGLPDQTVCGRDPGEDGQVENFYQPGINRRCTASHHLPAFHSTRG